MAYEDEKGPVECRSAEELTLTAVPLVHEIVRGVAARVPRVVNRDELLSAGLVAAMDAAREFEPEHDGDFTVYATAIVRSSILDVLRTADLEPHPEPDEPAAAVADERMTALRSAIDSLNERHRRVLDGYFLEDRPTPGLAAELGLAEAQVVQLRAEALMLLRDTMRTGAEDWPTPAAQSAYAAVAGRRLVQASSMPDVEGAGSIRRGA